jgi:hypothetical protein
MPQVGFEPTIPVFEWAKRVRTLDCVATVLGLVKSLVAQNLVYTSCQASGTQ